MSSEQDPPRLSELGQADPTLRAALRAVREEAPSPDQLAQLADGTLQALSSGLLPAAGVAKLGLLKLLSVVIAVGALTVAGWRWREQVQPDPRAPGTKLPQVVQVPQVAPQVAQVGQVAPQVAQVPQVAHGSPEPADVAKQTRADTQVDEAAAASPRQPASGETRVFADPAESAPGTRPRAIAQRPTKPAVPAGASARPATSTRATTTSAAGRERPPAEPDSESEVALIGAAQRLLASDAQRTLSLLQRHRALYPNGAFAEERDMLQLDALARLKMPGALRERAHEFLEKYPGSVHAPRVHRLLDQ